LEKDYTSFLGSLVLFFLIVLFELILGDIRRAFFLVLIWFLAHFIASVLRLMTQSSRPTKKKFKSLFEKIKAYSYPSMHAGRLALLFFSYSLFYSLNIFYNTLFLIILAGVSVTRYLDKKHHFLDLIGGILVAFITVFIMYWLFLSTQLF